MIRRPYAGDLLKIVQSPSDTHYPEFDLVVGHVALHSVEKSMHLGDQADEVAVDGNAEHSMIIRHRDEREGVT